MQLAAGRDEGQSYQIGSFAFLAVLAFGIRILAGLLLPEIIVYDDEIGYHRDAVQIAGSFEFGTTNTFAAFGWHTIIGGLYYLIAPDPFVIKILNSILGVASAFLLAGAVNRIYGNENIALAALYAGLFLPPLIFLSATILKEQAAAFGLSLFVYGVSRRDMRGVIWAVAAMALMIWMRKSYVFVMALAVVGGGLFAAMMGSRLSVPMRVLLIAALLTVSTFAAAVFQRTDFYGNTKVGRVLSGVDDRGYTTLSRNDMIVLQYLDRDNILNPRNFIVPPMRALYTPSPIRGLKSTSANTIIVEGIVRSLFWYIAVPFAVIAMFRSASFAHYMFVAVAVGVFLAAAYTVLTGFPETERYRWPMMPLLFVLATVGFYTQIGSRRRLILWGWWVSAIGFNAYYLTLI
tara:strand:+ start:3545 stop:4756 length:1212 start_codon:yes stop_codon:yes gene_type:complete